MNRYLVNVNGRELEVALEGRSGSRLSLVIEGRRYQIDVQPLLELASAGAPAPQISYAAPVQGQTAQHDSGTVSAPMPGIIVSIQVKPGDAVKTGQVVAVMEAMKMENNIAARRDGTVKEVLVKPGQEVNNGQALVTIE